MKTPPARGAEAAGEGDPYIRNHFDGLPSGAFMLAVAPSKPDCIAIPCGERL
jgi:hypothetical protein